MNNVVKPLPLMFFPAKIPEIKVKGKRFPNFLYFIFLPISVVTTIPESDLSPRENRKQLRSRQPDTISLFATKAQSKWGCLCVANLWQIENKHAAHRSQLEDTTEFEKYFSRQATPLLEMQNHYERKR